MRNTGATTWGAVNGIDYLPVCISGCPSGTYAYGIVNTVVAPGQQYTFGIQWGGDTFAWTRIQRQTDWRMMRNGGILYGSSLFGPNMWLTVIEDGESPLLTQSAPTCDNPAGVAWSIEHATNGNSVSCASSGMVMRQSASPAPLALLTTLSTYDSNNYHMHVHVHLSAGDSTSFAGFAIHTGNPDGCGGDRLWVRSDGTVQWYEYFMRYGQTTCSQAVEDQWTVSASSDYDLLFVQSSGSEYFFVNGTLMFEGGGSSYTPSGLAIQGPANAAAATFSGFEIDAPVAITIHYQLTS